MNAPLNWTERATALAAEFAQAAGRHDREGSFPFENFDRLHAAGLLTLAASPALGGVGASLRQLGEVIGAIGYGDAATALVLSMQYIQQRSMGRPDDVWPVELARRLVAEANERVSLVNALRVEPALGSPSRGGLPGTVARREGDGWRISGHKLYCTGAPILRWYAVWARTDEAEPRLGTFLVQAGREGIRIDPTWDHLGLRASGSHDIILDQVWVPDSDVLALRPPAGWAARDTHVQAETAVLIGALYTGVARAARDWLVEFLNTRKPTSLGAALATLPRAQEAVGVIEGLLATNARLIASVADDVDSGRPPVGADSALVKTSTTNNAVKVVEIALSLSSNHGLSRRNPLERHFRDVLCGRIHAPQDDAVHVAAGRRALVP